MYHRVISGIEIPLEPLNSLEINTSSLVPQQSPATYTGLINGNNNDQIIPEQYWVQIAIMVEDVR